MTCNDDSLLRYINHNIDVDFMFNKITILREEYRNNNVVDKLYFYDNSAKNLLFMYDDNLKYRYLSKRKNYRIIKNFTLKLDNVDEPSEIYYNKNGDVIGKIYYVDNCIHRDNDLPAKIVYFNTGSICYVEYYKNGRAHRENGPSFIRFDDNELIKREEYRLDGCYHREDGAAVIEYNYEINDMSSNLKQIAKNKRYYFFGNQFELINNITRKDIEQCYDLYQLLKYKISITEYQKYKYLDLIDSAILTLKLSE